MVFVVVITYAIAQIIVGEVLGVDGNSRSPLEEELRAGEVLAVLLVACEAGWIVVAHLTVGYIEQHIVAVECDTGPVGGLRKVEVGSQSRN